MTAPGTGWLTVAERGSLLGMYFVVWCSRIFGRRICAYLIVPVVGYFFVTGRAARRASRDYLARLYRWWLWSTYEQRFPVFRGNRLLSRMFRQVALI